MESAPRGRRSHLNNSRTTLAASLRVKRRRHYRAGPVTGRRGIPMLLALTMIVPALLVASVYAVVLGYEHYSAGFSDPDSQALNQGIRGAQVYDRNGVLLYEFIDEKLGVRLPVPLEAVSSAMIAATIATEDASFYNNPGVNPRGILRAAWENFSPIFENEGDMIMEGSGGSSITQQLVKNIYIDPEQRMARSIDRKVREAAYALELTATTEKDQILEWYFNQISYGGIFNGIEAAAQGYFGKPAAELTLAEAAMLAGIPQSPALYDPINNPDAALARRNEVLDLMLRHGRIQIKENGEENGVYDETAYFTPTLTQIEAAKREPLGVQPQTFALDAPHFVLNHVAPEIEARFGRDALYRDGLVVTTTIDMELQNTAQEHLERWISDFEEISNSRNGAVMAIDNRTGEVLVLIGSRSYYDEAIDGNVNNLTALNSPGSSFKPFVFLASFIELGWTPATMIQDTPVTFRESDGTVFRPENPTVGSYQGNITIGSALGNSLNIPPFRAVMAMGVPAVVNTAERVGFTTLTGQYGPSIAIGGVDLTAFDLTYGYSVLANNGAMVGVPSIVERPENMRQLDPAVILRVEDHEGNVLWDLEQERKREQVIPAEQAYLVTSALTNPQNMCITFGCGGVSIPGRVAGVKTGTSSPFDPNGPYGGMIGETWAFGYTPDYVVGVWAGNADNAPITNIFSTSISFRVMRDTLESVHRGQPSMAFERPERIQERTVCGPQGGQNQQQGRGQQGQQGQGGGANCRTELTIDGSPAPSAIPGSPTPTATPNTSPPVSNTPSPPSNPQASTSPNQPVAQQQSQPQPQQQSQPQSQPMAIVTLPGVVAGPVNVHGWAYAENMQAYRLEYSGAGQGGWQTIGESSQPVRGGHLGTWQTNGLAPGTYDVRLIVVDGNGGTISTVVQVQVGG